MSTNTIQQQFFLSSLFLYFYPLSPKRTYLLFLEICEITAYYFLLFLLLELN